MSISSKPEPVTTWQHQSHDATRPVFGVHQFVDNAQLSSTTCRGKSDFWGYQERHFKRRCFPYTPYPPLFLSLSTALGCRAVSSSSPLASFVVRRRRRLSLRLVSVSQFLTGDVKCSHTLTHAHTLHISFNCQCQENLAENWPFDGSVETWFGGEWRCFIRLTFTRCPTFKAQHWAKKYHLQTTNSRPEILFIIVFFWQFSPIEFEHPSHFIHVTTTTLRR